MTAGSAPADYRLYVGGNVSGQVAVGKNIIQIGRVEGGIVYVAQPGQTAAPRPRPTPVFQRPRPFRGLLDRRHESNTAAAALQSGLPVEFYGEPGIGKTVLLRNLAFELPVDRFRDGVVHLRVPGQTLDDILQNLYDSFYESDIPLKPTMARLRHALQDKEALILLDDVEVTPDDVDTLLDVAPQCTFLLTTTARRLWSDGRAIALGGLPLEDALALLERELGYTLADSERGMAQRWYERLQGHPFRLRQLASLARDEEVSLAQLAAYLPAEAPQLAAQSVAALPPRERRVALALAAVGGRPVSVDYVAAVAGAAEARAALPALAQRGLAQIEGRQVSLAGGVAEVLQQTADLAAYRERALATFTQLAQRQPATVAADSGAVEQVLNWAAGSGNGAEALRLVRAVEGALALNRQWGAWQKILQLGQHVAQATGNRSAEAWAWHQLGTRSLCLEEKEAARTALVRALRLRQALGEEAAAAISRHNLNMLLNPPPPRNGKSKQATKGGSSRSGGPLSLPVAVAVVVAAVVLATVISISAYRPADPGDTATVATFIAATATDTVTPTPTAMATVMATDTLTPTPTVTATATASPPPSATPCRPAPPVGWVSYEVQRGDTLFSLAAATGTTVDVIRQVNCLEGTLLAGTSLWLPVRPATPTPTPSPSPTATPTPALPDLVVVLELAGPVTITSGAEVVSAGAVQSGPPFRIPLRIVARNVGSTPAGFFVVAAAEQEYGLYHTFFRTSSLAGGGEVVFDDVVLAPAGLANQTITLVTKVDSCDGEVAATESACSVQEGDEANNIASLNVRLPEYRQPDEPPQVTIIGPGEGSVHGYADNEGEYWFAIVPLSGTAGDESGPVNEDALVWTTNRGDIALQQMQLGNGSVIKARLYSESAARCSPTSHTITLTATDSTGNSQSDSVTILLWDSCID